jgi:DNA topoisomerase-3
MEESEVRELVEKGVVGPLDGFISAKTRSRFAATLKLVKDEEKGKWVAQYDFGDKQDIATLEPFWTDPASGAQLCEAGNSYILRERNGDGEEWKQTFRVSRLMCQKPITRENAIQLVSEGKTSVIENFISKKGRPFSAMLKREGPKFSWEFPPRAPKLDKDGKPIPRKAKAPPDLSKAVVIGTSKQHKGGEVLETPEAYYVRRPDQDNRIVMTLKRQLCGLDLPKDEVLRLLDEGRTNLIQGFMSKRGMPFGAYLVLSKTGTKAEFEFPPR